RGIHAADTPATGPTPPSTDFRELSERRPALLWWVSTLVDTLDTEKRSAHEKSPPESGGLSRLSGSDPFPAGKGL
ncbi:hypothetical protein, partial [Stenotrophomonas maltophilia]|uniref:hypothetical protein n=1 Tax=Stenotrophomonas maltophilia TaxID=40324 RepID=UPI001954FCE6